MTQPMHPRDSALAHLQAALRAYGPELLLPPGRAEERTTVAPVGTDQPLEEIVVPAEPVRVAPRAAPAVARPAPAASTATAAAASPGPSPAAGATCAARLATLRNEVLDCTRCRLHEQRRNAVFGEGNPAAEVLFVGEAPGANEDQTGRPFVGPAGQLLERILNAAMGLRREDVYIANVNKCRPPGNRDPQPDEVAACLPYLTEQIRAVGPRVVVALGRVAAHNLLGRTDSLRQLRGLDLDFEGIPVVVTYHPAALLRDPSLKAETWEDVKRVNRMLGRPERPTPVAPG